MEDKMLSTMQIAGKKTVADWNLIRTELNDFSNQDIWSVVFCEFFCTRLKNRYLDPIQFIKNGGCYSGEGFSIMTIICSLIEFVESTYQGKNYRYLKKGDPPLDLKIEYNSSKVIFTEFLTLRDPFSKYFNGNIARDFYSNVRCGLLHEARTNGKWLIRGRSVNNCLLEITANENILYRDNFHEALLDYIKINYKAELLSSVERKEAFLRKFDNLFNE